MKKLWISHARILTQNDTREILNGHIEIQDNIIMGIHDLHVPIPDDVEIIDAQGLTLMPGFIQPHIHLCQTLFRNLADNLELLDWLSHRIWPFEAAHNPESIQLSAQIGIAELLISGTTTILDMATMRHTEEILKVVESSGIRANVGKCLMDHPKTCPPYLIESAEAAIEEAKALYERWHGTANDRIRMSYAPRFVVSCTEELLKQVGELAKQQGALIHTHSSENQKEVELVRELTGQDNVAYFHDLGLMSERLVLAHCIWLSEAEENYLYQTATHVVHCPSSNMKLASGFAKVPEMLDRGINVALAADGAPCNNTLDAFQEMRLAALLHKPGRGPRVMPASRVLDMITRNGAKALNWQDKIGSLEVGKCADIVALDLNHIRNCLPHRPDGADLEQLASAIVYATGPQQVRWTMVDGEIVARDGKALKLPEDQLQAEHIRAVQASLMERAQALVNS